VIHRDIKPANIMLDREETPSSRLQDRQGRRIQLDLLTVGPISAALRAEQCSAGSYPATDQYSLGNVAYNC
jgi:serine/threonine protein kinase